MPLSSHLGFLGNPDWQGVGALVAVLAIIVTVVFEIRKRRIRELTSVRNSPSSQLKSISISAPSTLYDLSTEAAEGEYYRALAESTRRATTIIYRSGRGFTEEPRKPYSRELINA